jgi:uncharacterized membrane protein
MVSAAARTREPADDLKLGAPNAVAAQQLPAYVRRPAAAVVAAGRNGHTAQAEARRLLLLLLVLLLLLLLLAALMLQLLLLLCGDGVVAGTQGKVSGSATQVLAVHNPWPVLRRRLSK